MKLKTKAGVACRVRRTHNSEFKARVAFAALREDKTLAQLCQEFDLQAKIRQITLEDEFLESALNKAGLLSARR